MKKYKLFNEVEIPAVGLGTWQVTERDRMVQLVKMAVACGYELFDTAAAYGNEIALGKGIMCTGLERKHFFISDKVWNTNRGFQETQDACKKSLKKLKLDYLDSYLIHWPASQKIYQNADEINAETWRGMEVLYREGYVRSIGVCNFKVHHLEKLKETLQIAPMINQIELHPGLYPKDILEYCQKNHIQIMASSPLGNGQILENNVILRLAHQKGKTPAQLCLRWALERNAVVIPKTVTEGRLMENMDIFDFNLDHQEMDYIDKIPYCGGIGIDPDEVTEFG